MFRTVGKEFGCRPESKAGSGINRRGNLSLTLSIVTELFTLSAEVVKLVDAVDSKSTGFITRAGSSPAFGTIIGFNKRRVVIC